uniref:Putative secreted protein n=1 Tax=Xenopsylla cheopis TaxID=163159 RepID=A0A6M2DYZ8_XENCH
MQHPWRTPLPISTLLVSPWSNLTLTFWFMYKFPPVDSYRLEQLHKLTPVDSVERLLPVDETRADVLINIDTSFRYYPQYSCRVPSSSTFFEPELILSYVLVYLVFESSVKESGHNFSGVQ